MARKEIPATEIINDDVTGKPITDAESVKVSLDGKTYALDMSAETCTAFRAFLAEPTDDTRRAFGALIPRPRVGKSAASDSGNGTSADKRAWLRANGYPDLAERGKFSDEQNAAYAARVAEPASPAASA